MKHFKTLSKCPFERPSRVFCDKAIGYHGCVRWGKGDEGRFRWNFVTESCARGSLSGDLYRSLLRVP